MHEGDADIEAYKAWLSDCFKMDETFTLKIGEACRVRNEHVDNLPTEFQNNGFHIETRFKLMYKRTDENSYHWLDSEGNQGVDPGPLEFYVKHWEKI